jgi:hypothetical protein
MFAVKFSINKQTMKEHQSVEEIEKRFVTVWKVEMIVLGWCRRKIGF